MKEIIRITIALTVSCMLAAFFMGMTYIFTAKPKKDNQHKNVQRTMLHLLGYGDENPAPADLKLNYVYRYIVEEGENKLIAYLVPVKGAGGEGFSLVLMNLDGAFVGKKDVSLGAEAALDDEARNAAVSSVMPASRKATYADSAAVAIKGGKSLGYLLPGSFPGFKTFIHVALALDPNFTIKGLEIMQHEEDPGLGAEIVRPYFKNQFKGKSSERQKTLDVIKEPLPDEYFKYLEAEKPDAQAATIADKYREKDIYAITGATISSRCVTDGVKGIVRKFAYRIDKLKGILTAQGIQSPILE